MRRSAFLAALTLAASVAAPMAARADTAGAYNLFVLHDLTHQGNDTEGRVAVGRNATLTDYSVGLHANAGDVNFVVGNNLSMTRGSVVGKTYVGGTGTYAQFSPSLAASNPVDFTAEGVRLIALSSLLKTYTDVGTVSSVNYGVHNTQFTFTGASAGQNVFNITSAALADTSTLNFVLAPGATALINVIGSSGPIGNMGMYVNGTKVEAANGNLANGLLWNFADATSLSFYSVGFAGSILAPKAAYSGAGVIYGQMIVDSFSGTYGSGTQVNSNLYRGSLLGLDPTAVPEPASWALMVGGFALVGGVLRRRRTPAVA